jgi:Zn-dependent metalloprotease
MKDFVHTQQDNGGVHINSGIPNHAFISPPALGGFAWEKAGYAWYDAVCDQSLAKTPISAFARLTIHHGEKRSGKETADAITQAWERVGVVL